MIYLWKPASAQRAFIWMLTCLSEKDARKMKKYIYPSPTCVKRVPNRWPELSVLTVSITHLGGTDSRLLSPIRWSGLTTSKLYSVGGSWGSHTHLCAYTPLSCIKVSGLGPECQIQHNMKIFKGWMNVVSNVVSRGGGKKKLKSISLDKNVLFQPASKLSKLLTQSIELLMLGI